jgi:hypothetical protein
MTSLTMGLRLKSGGCAGARLTGHGVEPGMLVGTPDRFTAPWGLLFALLRRLAQGEDMGGDHVKARAMLTVLLLFFICFSGTSLKTVQRLQSLILRSSGRRWRRTGEA